MIWTGCPGPGLRKMPPRILLLAGAPPASAVKEENCTVTHLEAPFHAFVAPDDVRLGDTHHDHQAAIAPWRSISLQQKPLHTGLSQSHLSYSAAPSPRQQQEGHHNHDAFFSTSSLPPSGDDADDLAALDEFCEHSLALHHSRTGHEEDEDEDEDEEDEATGTTLEDETSFVFDSTTTSAPVPAPPDIPSARLSRLRDVPFAEHVTSLQPQTVTLNLVVGILSIAQPRTVTTRRGQKLSLLEILVGDDTRSGFAVTFWLPTDDSAAPGLADLRRRDVVLMQNVALHVFRDKVYGQSLRRGLTRVHLLWTSRPDGRACYSSRALGGGAGSGAESGSSQLSRARTVRDWVITFVGIDPRAGSLKDKRHVWDRPPDDTQD